jgi:homocysteine S-methyltransferase
VTTSPFSDLLNREDLILTEGSVIERLRRDPSAALDPFILHAGFVYSPIERSIMRSLYREYLNAGRAAKLPMLILTPTWRANPDNCAAAGLDHHGVNVDAVRFVQSIRDEYADYRSRILIGGLIACRGDAYRPDQALSKEAAALFHSRQVRALAVSDVDFLMAATLPALSEALGIAQTLAAQKIPYVLSFVLRGNGNLLDGTPLHQAVREIDSAVTPAPVGYMINCVHPDNFRPAFESQISIAPELRGRVLGLQANTSTMSPEELEGRPSLDTTDPEPFGEAMNSLHRTFGLKILGGCCGTDARHIQSIAHHAARQPVEST